MKKLPTTTNLLLSLPTLTLLTFLSFNVYADLEAGLRAYEMRDYETAYLELAPLVSEGSVEAQFILSRMYRSGQHVDLDMAAGAQMLRLAADQGHAQAQRELANMMIIGIGVARNPQQAVNYMRQAAEQGLAELREQQG